jgi:hypothetical protein
MGLLCVKNFNGMKLSTINGKKEIIQLLKHFFINLILNRNNYSN